MSGNSALDDLADRNAVAIGRALAGGEASPVALTEHLLDRIDRTDDPVFLAVTADRALAEARMAEMRLARGSPLSPLDGVPIAWKDLVDMKGEVTTAGSGTRRDAPPATADAPVVVRATAAGMVNLGKVNLTEFAFSGLGHNPHFGTPFSPFGKVTRRTPGGSSSGSAVAITCGLAPCAIGTDTGGSVRIPAAFNGLVGFRTSEGRIDKRGVAPLSPTLDTVGPLARSVEDCVLLDMILRGAVGPEVRPRPVSQLSLLVPETVVLDDLDDAVAANFEQSVAHLEKAGARIRREKLDLFTEMARMTAELGSIVAAEAYLVHRELVDGPDVDKVDRRVVARIMGGKKMSAAAILEILHARAAMRPQLVRLLDGALIAMPTVPMTAPEYAPLEADDDLFHRTNLKALRNTMIGNFFDLPGLALPNGRDADGLPTSFLLSSTEGDDERLLGFGLSVESIIRT